MTHTFTSTNFQEEVLNSNIPVLVDFWAPWCGPCKMIGLVIEKLAENYEGKVKIGKCNIDNQENQQIAVKYAIQSIPSFKIFKNGKVVSEFVGMQSEDALKEKIGGIQL